ncbi:hypothetical protein TrRE_jg3817, partial [Triparma retinervis]
MLRAPSSSWWSKTFGSSGRVFVVENRFKRRYYVARDEEELDVFIRTMGEVRREYIKVAMGHSLVSGSATVSSWDTRASSQWSRKGR